MYEDIDEIETKLTALFRGSEAHAIVPMLCNLLRSMSEQIDDASYRADAAMAELYRIKDAFQ